MLMEESKQRRKRSERGSSPNRQVQTTHGKPAPYAREVNLEEMTMYASQKLEAMRSFRRDLKTSLEPILADLAVVRAKFKNKAYVEEGRLHAESGLLMGDFNEYLECLWLNPEHLERMLLLDEQAW